MNITGAVAGNPRLHHIIVLSTPIIQMTIVRSYRAAMFVLHVDTSQPRAMFEPRPRGSKFHQSLTLLFKEAELASL